VSAGVVCWHKGSNDPHLLCGMFKEHSATRLMQIDRTLEVSSGVLNSGHPRFNDTPSDTEGVKAIPVNVAFMMRPHRSLDIGPGAGLIFFNSEKTPTRFVITPVNVRWKPFLTVNSWPNNAWSRGFGLEFQSYWITKGFTASDFGTTTSSYSSGKELRTMLGISFDFGDIR
jgi:hypothetical protein